MRKIERSNDLEQIDINSVYNAKIIVLVLFFLSGIAGVGLGIFYLANSNFAIGLPLMFGVPIGLWLIWSVLKIVFGAAYDLKVIRYHLDNQFEPDIPSENIEKIREITKDIEDRLNKQ